MVVNSELSDQLAGNGERRVWIRAFWGFRPEDGGYLGFTLKGNRDRFIQAHQPGDLVLIYGADQKETEKDQRRQVLGFLEVDPVPISDAERSSEAEKRLKAANGWTNRWRYAVPVNQAWRIDRKIDVKHVARKTFETHNPVLIASRCELLQPFEAAAALKLPVTPVEVFGQPPLSTAQAQSMRSLSTFFEPTKGVMPSFGERNFSVEDADNRLYVLKLEGDTAAFLGRQRHDVLRKIVVKVGHAKIPKQRCDAHNAHLPPACQFRWKVELFSRPFSGGALAKQAEDRLKQRFNDEFESLGGEFFLVDETRVLTEFAEITRSAVDVIVGI